jgi:cytochrome c oxidase subunit 2
MMKKWLLFASAMCLVIVLAACGTNKGNEGANTAPTDNVEASAGEGEIASGELVITASNYKFDKKEYQRKT